MPKQKDPLAQPTVAAPVETPAQNAAESNTPDKVEMCIRDRSIPHGAGSRES